MPEGKPYSYNEQHVTVFPSQCDAARYFKLTSNANIHKVVTNKRNTCQGFTWRKVI